MSADITQWFRRQSKLAMDLARLLTPAGRSSFRRALAGFARIVRVHREGGLSVITWSGSVPVIRSVIQLDGDVMSFYSRESLLDRTHWQVHRDAIQRRLSRLHRHMAAINGIAEAASTAVASLFALAAVIQIAAIPGWSVLWTLLFTVMAKRFLPQIAMGLAAKRFLPAR